MALILYGKPARDFYAGRLKERIRKLGKIPVLVIIQVGNRPESSSYIQSKIKFGRTLGVVVEHIKLPEDVSEKELLEKVENLNEDDRVDGIIVQLPIPLDLPKQKVLDAIDVEKDVDGLSTCSALRRTKGSGFAAMPATARGVMELLSYYKINPTAKKTAILGRSQLAGGPIAEAMENVGAKITICHSHTKNEEEITKKSDIIVVAIGKPRFLNEKFIAAGKKQVVIDVGINSVEAVKTENGKLLEELSGAKFVGDVDFKSVEPLVEAISPVPGGVGAMTVLGLFENLIDCASKRSI